MIVVVNAADCLQGWRAASSELLHRKGEIFNLITEIDDATSCDKTWLIDFSPSHLFKDGDNVIDVINTIFPKKIFYYKKDPKDAYDYYVKIYERAKRVGKNPARNSRAWGTYFLRLIRHGSHGKNQIESVISALKTWPGRPKGALFIHIGNVDVDPLRPRNGPCWQYGQFSCREDGALDLTAVYRNHDFFNKALGNFIALGQLQKYIATRSGMRAGRLVCHSVHAYSGRPLQSLKALARL